MARGTNQKLKLLYLWKILLEQSDKKHPITLQKIMGELADREIDSERKSLYKDMHALREFGLDIRTVRKERQTWYYVGERTFAVSELKILIDSVLSSRYLTEKKTGELIRKLSSLSGAYAEQLNARRIYVPERIHAMSESLYRRIDRIHDAIAANRRLRFGYVSYTVDKQRQLRRNGEGYCASPYAVVWDDAHYYMIAYDSTAGMLKHFRIDKMESLVMDTSPREGDAAFSSMDLGTYVRRSFHMFGGEERAVTLQFPNRLVGVVLDRFGTDIGITPTDGEHFTVTVTVSVSPQFFGWVCGFAGDAVLLAPTEVVSAFRSHLQQLLSAHR